MQIGLIRTGGPDSVGVWRTPVRIFGFGSACTNCTAQGSFGDPKRYVDHIIIGASAIGKAREVATQHTQVVLFRGWCGRNRCIEAKHFGWSHVQWLIESFYAREKGCN